MGKMMVVKKTSVVNSPPNSEDAVPNTVDNKTHTVDAVIEQTAKAIVDKIAEGMHNSVINTTAALFTEDGVEVHFRSELERVIYLHATQGEKAEPLNGYYIYEIASPSMALRCYCHQRAQFYLSVAAVALPNPTDAPGNFKQHSLSKKYVCETHAQVELGLFAQPSDLELAKQREALTPQIEGQKLVEQFKNTLAAEHHVDTTIDNASSRTDGAGNSGQDTTTMEAVESGSDTKQEVASTSNQT